MRGHQAWSSKSFTNLFLNTPPQSGDTVLVFGGQGTAYHLYHNDPYLPYPETFPIVIPGGVKVKRGDSVPVFIGPVAGSAPVSAVFRFTDDPLGGTAKSRLEGIHILGSEVGVEIYSQHGHPLEWELVDCILARNATGLYAHASDGHVLDFMIDGCQVSDFADGSFNLIPAPRLLKHEIGLQFLAFGNGGAPPAIAVDLIGLTTAGSFEAAVMNPIAPRGLDPFAFSNYGGDGVFTRLVEVYVQGDPSRREYPGTSSATQTIPAIELSVNGGAWDGKAMTNSDRGWDMGLYAVADRPNSGPTTTSNYLCRYRVDFIGTLIEAMKLVGVYTEVNVDTRARTAIGDQTVIRDSGAQVQSSPDGFRHSGVFALARKGLLQLLGRSATIQDNVGCGVYYVALESGRGPLPFGGFLGLEDCGIHGNGVDGIHLLASPDSHPTLPRGSWGAVIGGTWDHGLSPYQLSFVPDALKPSDPNLNRQGQGYLDGCSISGGEGSRHGIHVTMHGAGDYDGGYPVQDYAAASLRVVNSYVWDFAQDAYHADISLPDIVQGPPLLTPIVHSTFANNVGYSFDIVHQPTVSGYTFYLAEPGTSGKYLNTSLNNCIFQRANPSALDLGPFLDTGSQSTNNWKRDPGTPDGFRHRQSVYLAGLRGAFNSLFTPGIAGDGYWLDAPTPFHGTPGGLDPKQWFLVNAGADSRFISSNPYLKAGSQLTEDLYDIEGVQRPAYPGRDKGGEED